MTHTHAIVLWHAHQDALLKAGDELVPRVAGHSEEAAPGNRILQHRRKLLLCVLSCASLVPLNLHDMGCRQPRSQRLRRSLLTCDGHARPQVP